MAKMLKIDPALCTGCAQCELACSWVQAGTFERHASVIRIVSYGEQLRFAPYTCSQCDEAWCMAACPTNAIAMDPVTGAKVVVEPACVGCAVCVVACPYGTIFFSPERNKATKCDLCRGEPACAQVCPTNALQFVVGDAPQDWIGPWAEAHNADYLSCLASGKKGEGT